MKCKGGLGVAYQDTAFTENTGCFPNLFSDVSCSEGIIFI